MGQGKEEKKTHWVRWLNLRKRKEKGGIGFKDIHNVRNIQLLTKQSWMILNNKMHIGFIC